MKLERIIVDAAERGKSFMETRSLHAKVTNFRILYNSCQILTVRATAIEKNTQICIIKLCLFSNYFRVR